ncbi:MAG: hypothetical protein ACFFCI_10225, partial [Promethearchaeota archaeon]
GKDLGEMLQKMGLSPDFKERFGDWHGYTPAERLEWQVKGGYVDPIIYELQDEYEVLVAYITTDAFGGEIQDIDHSDFRKLFYNKLSALAPKKLIEDDFIFLQSAGDLGFFPEQKDRKKKETTDFIKRLLASHQNKDSKWG